MSSDGVVGFDLDMTLVNSSAAIVDALLHVAATYGRSGDPEALARTVGLPLEAVFPDLIPGVAYDEALAVYRARYLTHGVAMTTLLPGARESLQLLREQGQRTIVVSAKHASHVDAVLRAVGLRELVDEVAGERFGAAKGEALAEHAAWAYVGDHPGDMLGAHAAGAVAVGVATGPTSATDLAAAGADVLLDSLDELPDWLAFRFGGANVDG